MKIVTEFFFRKLGLDLVPRQGAHMVEPDSMSVVELYHVHVASAENTQGISVCYTFEINVPLVTIKILKQINKCYLSLSMV